MNLHLRFRRRPAPGSPRPTPDPFGFLLRASDVPSGVLSRWAHRAALDPWGSDPDRTTRRDTYRQER